MREEGWITKAEAAEILKVDARTIERRARAGRITSKAKLGFPTLYLAADVEILQQAGSGEVRTGIVQTVQAGNGNGHQGLEQKTFQPGTFTVPTDDPIRQLAALVVQALTQGPIGPTGPTAGPTGPTSDYEYLTIREAAAACRLTQAYVRRRCEAGAVPAIRDRGWKIRRGDLEQL